MGIFSPLEAAGRAAGNLHRPITDTARVLGGVGEATVGSRIGGALIAPFRWGANLAGSVVALPINALGGSLKYLSVPIGLGAGVFGIAKGVELFEKRNQQPNITEPDVSGILAQNEALIRSNPVSPELAALQMRALAAQRAPAPQAAGGTPNPAQLAADTTTHIGTVGEAPERAVAGGQNA